MKLASFAGAWRCRSSHFATGPITLPNSADALVFGEGARGPDDDLRLQFEAIQAFSTAEKKIAQALLESLILRHQARRWASAS